MSQIIDLIKNNFDDALNAATRNNSDLVNVIEREKLLVSKITRPGNLYDYLDRYIGGTHHNAEKFRRLHRADPTFTPYEQLKDRIIRDIDIDTLNAEKADKYTIDNIVVNDTHLSHYENLCVFGGNRQESFRVTGHNVGLILKPSENDIRDDVVIVKLANSKPSTRVRIHMVENNPSYRYYVMKKLAKNDYLYIGQFQFISISNSDIDYTYLEFHKIDR